jgi:hypothetical protein
MSVPGDCRACGRPVNDHTDTEAAACLAVIEGQESR